MIMEKLSENKKGKRGRPRSSARQFVEDLPPNLQPEGCPRTKVNFAKGLELQNAILINGTEDQQRAVFGFTAKDIEGGGHPFPPGWKTLAVEAGRCIEDGGDAAEAADIVVDARRRGIKFSAIAAHFRGLRLGDREGTARALGVALARTLDRYAAQFPKTTKEQQRAAVARLLEIVDGFNDEGNAQA